MGNAFSFKSKQSKSHGACSCEDTCSLYSTYKHCCRQSCFGGHREEAAKAICDALKKYRADYLASTILSYLPDVYTLCKMDASKLSSDANYHSYTYGCINDMVEAEQPPCDVWCKSLPVDGLPGIKMVMWGSGGVGKSALTIRFVSDNFLEEYDPTIEDSYRKVISVSGKQMLVDILDTAGREEFSSMQDQWILEGKIIFICFSITSRSSWAEVELYRRRMLRTKKADDKDWTMVLVATKGDLEDHRQVSREEILEKVEEWNVPFIETSAKEKKNVEFMIEQGVYAYWMNSQTQCLNHR